MPFYGWGYVPNPRRDAALRALNNAERKGLLTQKECRVWRVKINNRKYDWRPQCLR